MAEAVASTKGIIEKPSNHPVDKTLNRLKNLLQAKGVPLFALMLAASSIAIDLPLKILVGEDSQGKTRISYNSP